MRSRAIAAALFCLVAMSSHTYADEAKRNILGLSPGMSQSDADRVVEGHKWNCDLSEYGGFATRDCIINEANFEKIVVYFNTSRPNHPVFRIRAVGTVSFKQILDDVGRPADIEGEGFHTWQFGNELELELMEIVDKTELSLSQLEFSPATNNRKHRPPAEK